MEVSQARRSTSALNLCQNNFKAHFFTKLHKYETHGRNRSLNSSSRLNAFDGHSRGNGGTEIGVIHD